MHYSEVPEVRRLRYFTPALLVIDVTPGVCADQAVATICKDVYSLDLTTFAASLSD